MLLISILASVSVTISGFLQPALHSRPYQAKLITAKNSEGGDEDGDEGLFRSIIEKKEEENIQNIEYGAGVPRDSLGPEEIVPLIMKALQYNNFPEIDAGLVSMWEFSGDNTKAVFKSNMTEFIDSCHETADEFPTSFYGVSMNGLSWNMESEINRVGGDNGWIATQVMKTISSDGRMRRWQWELRKNRRPPCLGCWKVENIASSDRQGNFQSEDTETGWND